MGILDLGCHEEVEAGIFEGNLHCIIILGKIWKDALHILFNFIRIQSHFPSTSHIFPFYDVVPYTFVLNSVLLDQRYLVGLTFPKTEIILISFILGIAERWNKNGISFHQRSLDMESIKKRNFR